MYFMFSVGKLLFSFVFVLVVAGLGLILICCCERLCLPAVFIPLQCYARILCWLQNGVLCRR